MAENVLRLEDVTMQFGGVVAVDNLTLHVDKGEIVALIGPNGAGKTTAFNCITGVYQPTNGRVFFEGQIIVSGHPAGKMKNTYPDITFDITHGYYSENTGSAVMTKYYEQTKKQ